MSEVPHSYNEIQQGAGLGSPTGQPLLGEEPEDQRTRLERWLRDAKAMEDQCFKKLRQQQAFVDSIEKELADLDG